MFILHFNVFSFHGNAQNVSEVEDYASLFKRLKKQLNKKRSLLWNQTLYGSILLVDRNTRIVFANDSDNMGVLKKTGDIFIGKLPKEINIANTSIDWGGKTWAMIMLPLPKNSINTLNLITHELFHRLQPELGFSTFNMSSCDHLDELEGRIYLKLELNALEKALSLNNKNEIKAHLRRALLFRLYRYNLYPSGKSLENNLELNEGIAEFTSRIISPVSEKSKREILKSRINSYLEDDSFVRSFAYYTIPVYGYFLHKNDKKWHLNLNSKSDLTDLILKNLNIEIPSNLESYVKSFRDSYSYQEIYKVESELYLNKLKELAQMDELFKRNPTLMIPFQKMNISFDPNNVRPYRNLGSIYSSVRIVDNWGILTVNSSALISKDWTNVKISQPTKIENNQIIGDGWQLKANPGWKVKNEKNQLTLVKE